jgi:acyl carrier protein
LLFASSTSDQLKATIRQTIEFIHFIRLNDPDWEKNYSLFNIMFTLCVGRSAFKKRVAFIADCQETLLQLLQSYLNGEKDPNIIEKCEQKERRGDSQIGMDSREAIKIFINTRDWHGLANQWVHENDISWDDFFESYEVWRVSLPTYCFMREYFPLPKPKRINSSDCLTTTDNEPMTADIVERKGGVLEESKRGNTQKHIIAEIAVRDTATAGTVSEIIIEAFSDANDIPKDKIEIYEPLEIYGIDSAKVVLLAAKLEKYFRNIPKTIFFQCRTVNDIIDYLIKNRPDEVKQIVIEREKKMSDREKAGKRSMDAPIRGKSNQADMRMQESTRDDEIGKLTDALLSDRVSINEVIQTITEMKVKC